MLAVLYKFTVKPDQEAEFIQAWKDLTEYIYKYQNSLGSRLHKASDTTFIAYAQWPDQETFDKANKLLPQEALLSRERMQNVCESIETLYELELVEDALRDS